MPEFTNPFAGVDFGRELTKDELTCVLRFAIATEQDCYDKGKDEVQEMAEELVKTARDLLQ